MCLSLQYHHIHIHCIVTNPCTLHLYTYRLCTLNHSLPHEREGILHSRQFPSSKNLISHSWSGELFANYNFFSRSKTYNFAVKSKGHIQSVQHITAASKCETCCIKQPHRGHRSQPGLQLAQFNLSPELILYVVLGPAYKQIILTVIARYRSVHIWFYLFQRMTMTSG